MVHGNEALRRGFTEILPRTSEQDGVERAVGGSDRKRDRAFHDAAAAASRDWKYSVESECETASEDKVGELEADEGEILGDVQTVG